MLTGLILYDELMDIFFELIFFVNLLVTLLHRIEKSWHVAAIFIQTRRLLIISISWVTIEWDLGSILSHGLWRLFCLFDWFLLLSRFEIGMLWNVKCWCWSLMMPCRWEKFECSAILLLMVAWGRTLFDIYFDRTSSCWWKKCNTSRNLWHILLHIHCH